MNILKEFIMLELKEPDGYVYAWVPAGVVPFVEREGLLAGKSLLNHPDALKALSDALGIGAMGLRRKIHGGGVEHLGPKVIFEPPPDRNMLSPNHPSVIRTNNLARIDWFALRRDFPNTKMWGMQIDLDEPDAPHSRWLTDEEVAYFMALTPAELWSNYEDTDDSGAYAPHVPHARISIKGSRIPPEYITFV